MRQIIADYGFYIGWSFGMTAFLMLLEPITLNSRRKSVLQRLRRLVHAGNGGR